MRKSRAILASFVVAVALAVAGSVAAQSGSAPQSTSLGVRIEPVRPYHPGDLVWWTTPPVAEPDASSLLSSGCQRVPASGYIGSGVYAESSSNYSNYWS